MYDVAIGVFIRVSTLKTYFMRKNDRLKVFINESLSRKENA
jgi:hypothetical protein